MSVVRLEGVSKWYGEVLGLSDVTLTIEPGLTGLLGSNGAGKSTLLKLVTGQLKPSRGTVSVLGEPVWNNPALMIRLGFCPEQDNFYEEMRGTAWLEHLAQLAGFDRREARGRAQTVLDQVGLAAERERRIGTYSKGMRQRIKFAQALLHAPDVLFLDEPLAGTDPIGRTQLSRLIKEFAAEGRPVVVSSHVLHEVEALTDTIVLLHQGRLRAEGSIEEIRRLLARHPSQVRIEVDRARELAQRLLGLASVVAAELPEPGALLVRTEDQAAFFQALPDIVVEGEFAVTRVVPLDDHLGALFRRLVRAPE